jgi:hypothetical protein
MSDNLIQLLGNQTNVNYAAEGGLVTGRSTRDGAAFSAPWVTSLVMQGKVFQALVGSFLTPVVGGGAGTIPDADQPEFGLIAPSGITVVPLSIVVQAEPGLSTTDSHYSLISASADLTGTASYAGSTFANTITPVNLLTGCGVASLCTVKTVGSGNMTTSPTESYVFKKASLLTDVQGTAATVNLQSLVLDWNINKEIPVFIKGGGNGIFVYWGGSIAMNAYAQVIWAEIPTSYVY